MKLLSAFFYTFIIIKNNFHKNIYDTLNIYLLRGTYSDGFQRVFFYLIVIVCQHFLSEADIFSLLML